jgi:hypothetical protein
VVTAVRRPHWLERLTLTEFEDLHALLARAHWRMQVPANRVIPLELLTASERARVLALKAAAAARLPGELDQVLLEDARARRARTQGTSDLT